MKQDWIWQSTAWPNFCWQESAIQPLLRECHKRIGNLAGKASLSSTSNTSLDTLLGNILASSAIENEQLNAASVRSSLAKHLGINEAEPYPTSDRSDGLAEMMMDALQQHHDPLTLERLFQWHRWLFPQDANNALLKVRVGELRGSEPMQVVSGRLDKPTVHFEAPPRDQLENELAGFISWFNSPEHNETNSPENSQALDPLVRAAIAHLWFITIHPFDDGNGRLTRALTDMSLAQGDEQSIRLFAMSGAILDNRKGYYDILEHTQKHTQEVDQKLDISSWVEWFLRILLISVESAITTIDRTLTKTVFWQRFNDTTLSTEQRKVLNRLLDGGPKGFADGISAGQYQKVAKVSKATATRHLVDLVAKGCIEKMPGGGRSTRYKVAI
ncbi:MAG: Fic family protein [Oleibacter sp.]|nr:Fic family protein [Thalassolituus sp.]